MSTNHFQNPIVDIKNHPQSTRDPKRLNPPLTTATSSSAQTATKIRKLQSEIQQLRAALCDSLDENDTLRMRVAQLEALLVEAQDQNQNMRERYICEEKRLINYWKMNQKYEMQMERICEETDTSFHRSRSM